MKPFARGGPRSDNSRLLYPLSPLISTNNYSHHFSCHSRLFLGDGRLIPFKGREEMGWAGAWGQSCKSRGGISLRPGLKTGNCDGVRTSYWQGPEQTRQKTARTVSRALRGSPSICVTRSKVRPQAISPRKGFRPPARPPPFPSHPCNS